MKEWNAEFSFTNPSPQGGDGSVFAKCPINRGFTLVEVLIALALGVLVLLPVLGVFSAALKAVGRTEAMCRAHVAAQAALQTTAASLRRAETVDELQVFQSPMRVVVRVRQGEDPATQTLSVAADVAEGESKSYGVIAFPPLRKSHPTNPVGGTMP